MGKKRPPEIQDSPEATLSCWHGLPPLTAGNATFASFEKNVSWDAWKAANNA